MIYHDRITGIHYKVYDGKRYFADRQTRKWKLSKMPDETWNRLIASGEIVEWKK